MDPLKNLLNLSDGKRQYVIDTDRVTKEEFEAAAIMSDVLWGQDGLAEMLGSTWRMVHDPRFLAVERCGIYEQRNMFSPGAKKMGVQVMRSSDLFGDTGGSIDDMSIYAEVLGEGRHFRDVVIAKGWDPAVALTEAQAWELIEQECPNYKRRDGSWNREGQTLKDLLLCGLVSLVHDYADVAFCTDWVRMDTQEVVVPGQRIIVKDEVDGEDVEDDVPVIAVEVDNLHRALTLRGQVRMTAYRVLRNFPGIKKADLDNLVFTDLESDEICQALFAVKFDEIYKAMPRILFLVQQADSRTIEERQAEETKRMVAESGEFNAKLKSGEIEHITTEISEAPEGDASAFMAQLTNNPYYVGLFTCLQTMEARGSVEATNLCLELLDTKGAGDIWDRISELVKASEDPMVETASLQTLANTHGMEWKERSVASSMVLGENVHANTTEVEGVFTGQGEQVFDFVYLNPHADARGHRTAVVDVRKEDGSLDRRTWSISPMHYRDMKEQVGEDESMETLPWVRSVDHNLGTTSFKRVAVEA